MSACGGRTENPRCSREFEFQAAETLQGGEAAFSDVDGMHDVIMQQSTIRPQESDVSWSPIVVDGESIEITGVNTVARRDRNFVAIYSHLHQGIGNR